jgi:hypothetical protein
MLCKNLNGFGWLFSVESLIRWMGRLGFSKSPLDGRGPSARMARTVRPPGADSPAPDRKFHFLSLCCGVINYSPMAIYHIYIAVVWVVLGRSLPVVSSRSALVQMMQIIIQLQTLRLNPQLGAASLWTQRMFHILIQIIQSTSQDGLIQREDSLWLSTAPGGQLLSMICPQTPTFSFFILSFNLMSSGER